MHSILVPSTPQHIIVSVNYESGLSERSKKIELISYFVLHRLHKRESLNITKRRRNDHFRDCMVTNGPLHMVGIRFANISTIFREYGPDGSLWRGFNLNHVHETL